MAIATAAAKASFKTTFANDKDNSRSIARHVTNDLNVEATPATTTPHPNSVFLSDKAKTTDDDLTGLRDMFDEHMAISKQRTIDEHHTKQFRKLRAQGRIAMVTTQTGSAYMNPRFVEGPMLDMERSMAVGRKFGLCAFSVHETEWQRPASSAAAGVSFLHTPPPASRGTPAAPAMTVNEDDIIWFTMMVNAIKDFNPLRWMKFRAFRQCCNDFARDAGASVELQSALREAMYTSAAGKFYREQRRELVRRREWLTYARFRGDQQGMKAYIDNVVEPEVKRLVPERNIQNPMPVLLVMALPMESTQHPTKGITLSSQLKPAITKAATLAKAITEILCSEMMETTEQDYNDDQDTYTCEQEANDEVTDNNGQNLKDDNDTQDTHDEDSTFSDRDDEGDDDGDLNGNGYDEDEGVDDDDEDA
ncbi:MAG: hypothetical protein AAB263_07260 [Planctomycetota bacterium]